MNILLYVSLAWVALCVLFVGLDLIFLLMTERASDTSQAMMTDERISDRAPHMAKLDLACGLADACDALAQLEDRVTLVPRGAIPVVHRAVADRTQHAGAVIIRDPRLTRARTLSDQTGGAAEAGARTSPAQEIGAISEAMEVLGHH
jgi:hypothetical protein